MRVERIRRPFRDRDRRPRRTISTVEMGRRKRLIFDRRRLRRMPDLLARVFVLGSIFHYDFVSRVSLTSFFYQLVSGIEADFHERLDDGFFDGRRLSAA